jgi:hypothetical protein
VRLAFDGKNLILWQLIAAKAELAIAFLSFRLDPRK